MINIELFKEMFSKNEFDSLLNTGKKLTKDESTESWKNSKQIFLQDSGHKIHSLENKIKDGLNFWAVFVHHDCIGWKYRFIGNNYDDLIEESEEILINLDRLKKLNDILV